MPPHQIGYQCQVFGPGNVVLCVDQIGLKQLDLVIAIVQDRIEIQGVQAQKAHLMACLRGGLDITFGHSAAKAVVRRVAEDYEHAFALHDELQVMKCQG